MAKKLDAGVAKQLKALGIKKVTTEEDAKKELCKILEKEGIEGMDDESLDTLIGMVESFVSEIEEPEDNTEELEDTEETDDEETEADELADEVEAEDAAEEEETDDSEEADDDEEEDDEEPEEEVKKPVKKATKKAEPKPVKKQAVKKAVTPATSKKGTKLDPKNNSDDRKYYRVLEKLFPTDAYQYDWISSHGVTIKHVGNNGKRGVCSLDASTLKSDGSVVSNLFLLTMRKNNVEKLEENGWDYSMCFMNCPVIKAVTMDEVMEILTVLHEDITGFVNKIDKRLGDNRKKMEENLEAQKPAKKQAAKKATKPVPQPVDDEEEDDEEPEEEVKKPVKKATKKAEPKPVKKSSKK